MDCYLLDDDIVKAGQLTLQTSPVPASPAQFAADIPVCTMHRREFNIYVVIDWNKTWFLSIQT